VKAGAIADEDRRRSAEAVRRIREESARRVARQRHRRGFSWCMVASLAGGLSLAAMDAYEARLKRQAQAATVEEAAAAEPERVFLRASRSASARVRPSRVDPFWNE
jgi:hypothetical protein